MVSVIKKPTSDAEDVEKIPIMPGKDSALLVDLEDPRESEVTNGRIKISMEIG